MKKVFAILIAVLMTASVFAQTPEKMSYQAVIRNSSNTLLTNTQVGMQISILQSSATGTAVYVETQTPTTNANGLVSIEIGNGTVDSGNFSTIDWANGPYFIKTETDPSGGTNYTITGTSQLLSVPYALHAKTAESISGDITETDPMFSGWDKSIGISITENQISNLGTYLETETDPLYSASVAQGITANDTAKWNLKYNTCTETDPLYLASVAQGITASDTANWNNKPPVTDSIIAVLDTTTQFVRTEIDGSVTNELQTISRTGLTVTLSNGGGTYSDSVNTYTAGNGIAITNNVVNIDTTYYVGKLIGPNGEDGVVFYVDHTGQHGLICSPADMSTGAKWSNIWNVAIGTSAESYFNGSANTTAIIEQSGHTSSAAKLCRDYSTPGTSAGDWYLPSFDELSMVYHAKHAINRALFTNRLYTGPYWSSTESDGTNARLFGFDNGYGGNATKDFPYKVVAIRSF